MSYDKNQLEQLANPSGLNGACILGHLNKVNAGINDATFRHLRPETGDKILETGFGGGALLERIASSAPGILGIGVDISKLAVSEATQRLKVQVNNGTLRFHTTEPGRLPFDDGFFDKVCCVNVIYFWSDPIGELAEIYRVTKPGGLIVLSYAYGSPDKKTKFPTSKVADWLKATEYTGTTHQKYNDHENGTYFCTTAYVEK